jgi:hypothetical protein
VLERPDLDDASVIDHDIDAAITLYALCDGAVHIATLPDVSDCDENIGVRMIAMKIVGGPLKLLRVARNERHVSPFTYELTAEYESEPAGTASDEDHLSLELVGARRTIAISHPLTRWLPDGLGGQSIDEVRCK